MQEHPPSLTLTPIPGPATMNTPLSTILRRAQSVDCSIRILAEHGGSSEFSQSARPLSTV